MTKICPLFSLVFPLLFTFYSDRGCIKHVEFLPVPEIRSLLHVFWKRESFQPCKGRTILWNVKIPLDPSPIGAASGEVDTVLMSTIFQITPHKMNMTKSTRNCGFGHIY